MSSSVKHGCTHPTVHSEARAIRWIICLRGECTGTSIRDETRTHTEKHAPAQVPLHARAVKRDVLSACNEHVRSAERHRKPRTDEVANAKPNRFERCVGTTA